MNNLNKINLSERTINKLVNKAIEINAFKIENNIHSVAFKELKNGYFNTIYLLQLNDFEVILKIAPLKNVDILRYEKNIMQAEAEALNIIKQKTTISVPEVYFYENSREIESLEYFFMQKIDGECLNNISEQLTADESSKIEFKLGVINKKINEISNSKFGYLSQPQKQSYSWGEAFFNIVTDILADGKDANVSLPYDDIENIFKKFLYVCDDVKTPKLVHWDLWPGNVLIENNKVSGIIDFERALWADPLMEYYFSDILNNKYFCEGYGISLNGLDENSKIRRKLYNLYLYLVLKIECCYRNYTDSSQSVWAEQRIFKEINEFKF